MKILIANLGSTSFKYRLFDVSAETDTSGDERELASGGVERIGSQESRVYASLNNEAAQVNQIETIQPIPDHGVALEAAITQLTAEGGPLSSIADVAAIGFKAVHGGKAPSMQRAWGALRVAAVAVEPNFQDGRFQRAARRCEAACEEAREPTAAAAAAVQHVAQGVQRDAQERAEQRAPCGGKRRRAG